MSLWWAKWLRWSSQGSSLGRPYTGTLSRTRRTCCAGPRDACSKLDKESWDMINVQFWAEYSTAENTRTKTYCLLSNWGCTWEEVVQRIMHKNVQWQLRCTMYMRGVTSNVYLTSVPEWCYVLELIAIESGRLPGKMLCQRWGQSIGAGKESS